MKMTSIKLLQRPNQTFATPGSIFLPIDNLHIYRTLDNHYDPRVHEKPWIASGHLKD